MLAQVIDWHDVDVVGVHSSLSMFAARFDF